jgi:hypothetical protein
MTEPAGHFIHVLVCLLVELDDAANPSDAADFYVLLGIIF